MIFLILSANKLNEIVLITWDFMDFVYLFFIFSTTEFCTDLTNIVINTLGYCWIFCNFHKLTTYLFGKVNVYVCFCVCVCTNK